MVRHLLRLARLAAFVVEALQESRTTLRYRGVGYLLLVVLCVVFLGAALVLEVERAMPEANIDSYADALWWAMATVSTVGYGDRFPVSSIGRGIAAILMVTGIALFGAITATLAAYFAGHAQDDRLLARVEELHAKLDELQARLDLAGNGNGHGSACGRGARQVVGLVSAVLPIRVPAS